MSAMVHAAQVIAVCTGTISSWDRPKRGEHGSTGFKRATIDGSEQFSAGKVVWRPLLMDFLASLPRFNQDLPARNAFQWFEALIGARDAVCYYKYPIVGVSGKPDLVFLVRDLQPIVVRTFPFAADQIRSAEDDSWRVTQGDQEFEIDAPALTLDDLATELQARFDKVRYLRRRLTPQPVVALPLCSEADFWERFGHGLANAVWAGGDQAKDFIKDLDEPLTDTEWKLARSVLQSAIPLTKSPGALVKAADTLGSAIKVLDAEIALLDEQQNKVAIQIPPGPQRIRGLAGTGKTVLLAMKAANIHHHFPDQRILLTFNTQSLYNQARNLVTRFFRFYSDVDPDWDMLHIRHAWGGRSRQGVYFDLCQRQGAEFLNFKAARAKDPEIPFRACCVAAMQHRVDPLYDYVLVDEAQDFPKEFFPLLFRLSNPPHAIYWAYDELQSLASLEIPSPSELFGADPEGKPLVSLDIDNDDGMDRDLVLLKSYRCPQEVLMLAHGVGLGIHNPRGPVQMLGDENSWRAVGYTLESGKLRAGDRVVLYRPPENSPNRIKEIYSGRQPLIYHRAFDTMDQELEWVASQIARDVNVEHVPAEQIVVISLNSVKAKEYMVKLQSHLVNHNVASTIPGLVDDAAEFAEPGMVTLSTVFRAKGNEAPVVYIISFQSLYDFAEEIENRNRAFTSISRSKGWVRITGTGSRMVSVEEELRKIVGDIPRFGFVFPDMAKIRKLDASETTRRRHKVRKAREAVELLKALDPDALSDLSDRERGELLELLQRSKQ